MMPNSLGSLGEFQEAPPKPGLRIGMQFAGLSEEQIAAMQPPPPRPMPPMAPRYLSREEVASRLRDAGAALARLERSQNRADFDPKLLVGEIKANLEMLSGEIASLYRAIEQGRPPEGFKDPLDTTFFMRARESRRLLLHLLVPPEKFLPAAKSVFDFLQASWPKSEFPSDPVCSKEN